jgi:thioredoxin-related protein
LQFNKIPLFKALCILAWLIAHPAVAQGLPPASDLAADATRARALHAPLLLLFSEPSCDWCERARREYLVPMQNDAAYRGRVIIREVDTTSNATLVDFAGRATTQREYATLFHVRKVPVVALLGPEGQLLGEPMVGMAPDFYQFYLDDAIDRGRRQLGAAER